MGSILKEQSEDIKDSEVKEYKEVSYKLFQIQDYKVKASNGEFRCPFCACKDEPDYGYAHLLQHAIRVAEGSISGKQRVKHSAMARYLAVDLGSEVNAGEGGRTSDEEWVAPSCRKRLRSCGSSSKINRRRKAVGNVNAQKVAMAEKREKEALDQVKELERKMNEMRNEMNAVITREQNELQRVRTELIKEKALSTINKLNDGQKRDNSGVIGVKKIGKIDAEVFKRAYKKRFSVGEAVAEIKGIELCSKWQDKLKSWWPLKRILHNKGNIKRVVDDKDTTLCALKNEWGDEAYNAVVTALLDVHRFGSLDQYDIWNFKENRKAKLEEVICWIRSGRKELPESGYLVFSIK